MKQSSPLLRCYAKLLIIKRERERERERERDTVLIIKVFTGFRREYPTSGWQPQIRNIDLVIRFSKYWPRLTVPRSAIRFNRADKSRWKKQNSLKIKKKKIPWIFHFRSRKLNLKWRHGITKNGFLKQQRSMIKLPASRPEFGEITFVRSFVRFFLIEFPF